MTVTFHPKRLLVTTAFLAGFGLILARATEVSTAVAGVGAATVIAYVLVELFATFNPAIWGGWRRPR